MIFSDITDRKRTEEREVAAKRLLESLSHVQAHFIEKQDPAQVFNILLTNLLELTTSEYGFIGEVLFKENGDPYLRTHAITDLAWNDETRQLLNQFAPNLEFYNLKTLFGRVMTTGATDY